MFEPTLLCIPCVMIIMFHIFHSHLKKNKNKYYWTVSWPQLFNSIKKLVWSTSHTLSMTNGYIKVHVRCIVRIMEEYWLFFHLSTDKKGKEPATILILAYSWTIFRQPYCLGEEKKNPPNWPWQKHLKYICPHLGWIDIFRGQLKSCANDRRTSF